MRYWFFSVDDINSELYWVIWQQNLYTIPFLYWRIQKSLIGGKMEFWGCSMLKNTLANAEDLGSVPEWGRSPGKGNGYQLQYFCLENSMDRGAWRATVHGVTELAKVGHDYANTSTFLLLLIIKSEMKIIRWLMKRKMKNQLIK